MPKIYVTASTGRQGAKERAMDAGSAISSRLPHRARWLIGDTTLDFSLYSAPRNLTAVTAEFECDLPDIEQVSDFIVFGMWNFNEGGGARPFLVVRQSDSTPKADVASMATLN